jgi:hypothetical protein
MAARAVEDDDREQPAGAVTPGRGAVPWIRAMGLNTLELPAAYGG